RRGHIVAVPMARSADAVTATLGILRAGCAYLPLDVRQPGARTRQLIEQTGAQAAVVDTAEMAELMAGLVPALRLDQLLTPDALSLPGGQPLQVTAEDPACVICTSGSTGMPKAVV